MSKLQEEMRKKWAQVVAKAWTDEKFKKKLMEQSGQVLKEHGIEASSGQHFKIIEDTKTTRYLVIPSKPEGKLSETELKNMAAAGQWVPVSM